jgi:hypothetical protein
MLHYYPKKIDQHTTPHLLTFHHYRNTHIEFRNSIFFVVVAKTMDLQPEHNTTHHLLIFVFAQPVAIVLARQRFFLLLALVERRRSSYI